MCIFFTATAASTFYLFFRTVINTLPVTSLKSLSLQIKASGFRILFYDELILPYAKNQFKFLACFQSIVQGLFRFVSKQNTERSKRDISAFHWICTIFHDIMNGLEKMILELVCHIAFYTLMSVKFKWRLFEIVWIFACNLTTNSSSSKIHLQKERMERISPKNSTCYRCALLAMIRAWTPK